MECRVTQREIGMVHNLVRRLTAGWSHVSIHEDLVGTGLLGVAEAADRYDPGRGAPFTAVAAIHARGRMLDVLRREVRSPRKVTGSDGEPILITSTEGPAFPAALASSLESTLTRREVVAALGRALDALPPRERDALRAIYMEGCATAEVAARLGVSRRAVNLICERGRRRLRELLRGFAPEAAALFG